MHRALKLTALCAKVGRPRESLSQDLLENQTKKASRVGGWGCGCAAYGFPMVSLWQPCVFKLPQLAPSQPRDADYTSCNGHSMPNVICCCELFKDPDVSD